ncbi:hypothetical protein [Actinokineospora globicatena]|uniref:Uncharacterized protein n=1 Tax=Actinokineospora globicatena TaxID=103729 RepID=A0A9W6QQP7_9PSEU|nr:hypothetical protein [Actinokineospora globicatena]GLW94778.1 hypothetical protein Aglo03_55940 [Actinokineospora globicatena]
MIVVGLALAACTTPEAAPLPATAGPNSLPGGSSAHGAPQQFVQIGESFPYRLMSHCGIKYATFAGQNWVAEQTWPDPERVPDFDGKVVNDGFVSGRVVLLDDRTLRFKVDPATIAGKPTEVIFHPTDVEIPLCK